MKKRVFAALLCLALLASLVPAAFAVFADVPDQETARNAEVLRMLGIMEGDGEGRFRPNSNLTRAEFCKMAVVLSGKRSVVTRYASRTVFPDVRAPHWAAGYVNYAASEEAGMIHGLPDGTFQPDRAISYGEAVTILMRRLGYTDKDTGGIWPDGYLALAGEAGMLKDLNLTGGAAITRAQAAKLFVNALTATDDEGKTLLTLLGYTCDMSGDPVTIWSVDLSTGKVRLSDGTTYEMENPMELAALKGVKGYLVTRAKKVAAFLPVLSVAGGAVSDAAIIVSADGSTVGVDALTGGADHYAVYRNGARASVDALKKGDVVTYNAAINAIQACDTRVLTYYENCEPSPATPTKIKVLCGTEFDVLPTAQASLAAFKPGKTMILLLAADGRVAGAVENGGASVNAFGYVNGAGKLSLICGGTLIPLEGTYADYAKQAVRITQSGKTVNLYKQTNTAAGALNVKEKTLGDRKLADGVLVFENGEQVAMETLTVIDKSRIAYARTNAAGEVDLIVIVDSGNTYYGIAKKGSGTKSGYPFEDITYTTLQVNYGTNRSTSALECAYAFRDGDYVEAVLNADGTRYTSVTTLSKLAAVPASAWIGDTVVNYGGQTYTVSADAVCYNRDAGAWFDGGLAAAKAYGGTMDLYVKDGVVRAVEVRA